MEPRSAAWLHCGMVGRSWTGSHVHGAGCGDAAAMARQVLQRQALAYATIAQQ